MSKKELETKVTKVKDDALQIVDKAVARDKTNVVIRFLSLSCYGGLASVLLAYYTDAVRSHATPEDRQLLVQRFVSGLLLFPASRLVLQLSYYVLMRDQMNSVIVSGLGGAFCGLLFGVRGNMPDPTVSALGFAAGAMLTDIFS